MSGPKIREAYKLKKKLKEQLNKALDAAQNSDSDLNLNNLNRRDIEKFISSRLSPLIELATAFIELLKPNKSNISEDFSTFIKIWVDIKSKEKSVLDQWFNRFFRNVGQQLAVFALWFRNDLNKESVKFFMDRLHEQEVLNPSVLIEVVSIISKRDELQVLAGQEAIRTKRKLESENDTNKRVSLFGKLGRALIPASIGEASSYFELGLDQMESIGSMDHTYTNELLIFSSSLKGEELDEKDFHTLTNICELNIMPQEEEKFPWTAFANGFAQVSGLKTLAKLARWDDRNKISLQYTLLPYLTALLNTGKISAEYAIALNRLVNPAELHTCDTVDLAEALKSRGAGNLKKVFKELVQQFEENRRGGLLSRSYEKLGLMARNIFGEDTDEATYLLRKAEHYERVSDERNEHMNHHGKYPIHHASKKREDGDKCVKKFINQLKPTDKTGIEKALEKLDEQYNNAFELKNKLLKGLRCNVSYQNRSEYIVIISQLENKHIDISFKLNELSECKKEWQKSSISTKSTFNDIGVPLLQMHYDEFVSFGRLSGYTLNRLSELAEITISALSLELIKLFTTQKSSTHSAVWLSLASYMCDEAAPGEGEEALSRLLNSESAKLSKSVVDGQWITGLYPERNEPEVAAGLIWRMLGSPKASDRWHAAHCMRRFAKFGRWEVIDKLIDKYSLKGSSPFQAPELKFYFLHARLWLLISLARMSLDYPEKIVKHESFLERIALDKESSHILIKYFASRALINCVDEGGLSIPQETFKKLKMIGISPYPKIDKDLPNMDIGIHRKRPEEAPKPKSKFYLDLDFQKYQVKPLARAFGKPTWLIKDYISEIVADFDTTIHSMYDLGDREVSQRRRSMMSDEYHGYGQYLGWHSLFILAEDLLANHVVRNDRIYDNPWEGWLKKWLLSRNDGIWLSDGMDKRPLEVTMNLLEKGEEGLIITGSENKTKKLIGLKKNRLEKLVVSGLWSSHDNISVSISSSLVKPENADSLAYRLSQTDPIDVWLPVFEKYEQEDESLRSNKYKFIPWIARYRKEAGLDEFDPLGASITEKRHYFSQDIVSKFSLSSTGPFKRIWKDPNQDEVAYSEAWGYEDEQNGTLSNTGVRLLCNFDFLTKVLKKNKANLIVLINLQRYQKGTRTDSSKFSNTVAVVRINKFLEPKFYQGAINRTRSV